MSRLKLAAASLSLALVALAVPLEADALELPRDDGWYSWEVQASSTGSKSCCYGWHGGQTVLKEQCNLDGKRGDYVISGDCLLESDRIRVYVRMENGKAERIRALNADCPVTTSTEVTHLGSIETGESVGWLSAELDGDRRNASDRLAAITMHDGEAAFVALRDVVTDRDRSFKLREEALFWIAQSDNEEAFEFIDRLLTSR